MPIEKDVAITYDTVLVGGDANRLLKNGFGYCFRQARLSTTGASAIEHNKDCDQVSKIRRGFTTNDGVFLFHFDKNDESPAGIKNTSSKHLPVNTPRHSC